MRLITTAFLITLTVFTAEVFGQEKRLFNGIVTDGRRNGLSGINVIVKGTTAGTVTDICGRFSIPIDRQDITLLFHGISYNDLRTYEIKLTKTDLLADTLVFQLGRLKVDNTGCVKIDVKLKRRVID